MFKATVWHPDNPASASYLVFGMLGNKILQWWGNNINMLSVVANISLSKKYCVKTPVGI